MLVILATCTLSVYEHQRGSLSTATVGFILTFVLRFPSTFMWLVRYVTQLEIDAVSLERLGEYAALPHEEAACALQKEVASAPTADVSASADAAGGADGAALGPASIKVAEGGSASSSASAPAAEGIVFSAVRMAYGPGKPLVLRDMSVAIPAGAKVAVIGRTGAGKSTTTQILLRLYPFEAGTVRLAGHDLADMSVAAGRRLATALLQDAFLFSGTVRDNLTGPVGPGGAAAGGSGVATLRRRSAVATAPAGSINSGDYHAIPVSDAADSAAAAAPALKAGVAEPAKVAASDSELWAALQAVGMRATVEGMAGGLDAPVREGGANLSAGERALLALARALVRRSSLGARVWLADEPTAAVDHASDRVVHETLLSLPDTVVCICHRLHFAPRFDLVAVIDGGRVAELAPPAVLAANPQSLFARLLAAARASGSVWRA